MFAGSALNAQYFPPDSGALQGVVVETYYIADANDAADTDGGDDLEEDYVTYRVYVDMKPGYILESVFGNADHELNLNTTTVFFNNTDRGEVTGDLIDNGRLDENTVAIDSWLSMGAASDAHWGVLKDNDTDGSIVGGVNNDGGSNGVPGGLLVNDDPAMGLPPTTADGLVPGPGTPPAVTAIGLDLDIFDDTPGSTFNANNGAWAVLGGTTGVDTLNHVLIAQITTGGTFCFDLNMRIGIPDSLQCQGIGCHTNINYYAMLLPSDTAGGGPAADNQLTNASLVQCHQLSTSIEEGLAPAPEISVFPNPSQDETTLSVKVEGGQEFSYNLYGTLGEIIRTKSIGRFTGTYIETLDISNFSQGVYLLEVFNGNSRSTKRIVKY